MTAHRAGARRRPCAGLPARRPAPPPCAPGPATSAPGAEWLPGATAVPRPALRPPLGRVKNARPRGRRWQGRGAGPGWRAGRRGGWAWIRHPEPAGSSRPATRGAARERSAGSPSHPTKRPPNLSASGPSLGRKRPRRACARRHRTLMPETFIRVYDCLRMADLRRRGLVAAETWATCGGTRVRWKHRRRSTGGAGRARQSFR